MTMQIECKTILNRVKQPDTWFGLSYTMNLYRGCRHGCIYCDSRSDRYGIRSFERVAVKANAIHLLRERLPRIRRKGTVGTGAMSDPYQPLEKRLKLTRRALEALEENGFPVHVMTKSDLVMRDIDLLQSMGRVYSAVSFSVTAAEDETAARLEPGAPSVTARMRALRTLRAKGIYAGVALMPVLPFLTDSEENVVAVFRRAVDAGARFVLPWFGMTLRDGQREYYYRQLDRLYPGARDKYEKAYGDSYHCSARRHERLHEVFEGLCNEYDVAPYMRFYEPFEARQLKLFG
ncbi:radical SAM protein [Candidatus Fermentibacteria bacterium]|nr:radical SAM protein [Candidatus Fermentibacteria bacterium]